MRQTVQRDPRIATDLGRRCRGNRRRKAMRRAIRGGAATDLGRQLQRRGATDCGRPRGEAVATDCGRPDVHIKTDPRFPTRFLRCNGGFRGRVATERRNVCPNPLQRLPQTVAGSARIRWPVGPQRLQVDARTPCPAWVFGHCPAPYSSIESLGFLYLGRPAPCAAGLPGRTATARNRTLPRAVAGERTACGRGLPCAGGGGRAVTVRERPGCAAMGPRGRNNLPVRPLENALDIAGPL